jgi:hypothetical protein
MSKEQEKLEVNIFAIEEHLRSLIADKEKIIGKLNEINSNIKIAKEQYDNAITLYTEYLQKGGGIKRKLVKRKVISIQSAKASRPVKPTSRKPTIVRHK